MGFDNVNVNVCGGQSIIKALQNYNTIILKPNIVDNRNVLTQEMMSERHTKYVIRWNYSLEGATINVPKDCIIEFAGGTIDNGTIVGDNTIMIYSKPIDEVCPAERQGTFIYNTTVADEEDITSETGQLKFKNRPATDGMGRKILRKNIVNGVNTLTQSMINQPNTIYVIQYDFILDGNITVSDNCVLEFDGGSLSNGTLNGNILIEASEKKVFNNIVFGSNCTFVNDYKACWSCESDEEDVTNVLNNILDVCSRSGKTLYLQTGIYNITSTLKLRKGNKIIGASNYSQNPEIASKIKYVGETYDATFGNNAEYDVFSYYDYGNPGVACDILIERVFIDGSLKARYGINFSSLSYSTFREIFIKNMKWGYIYANSSLGGGSFDTYAMNDRFEKIHCWSPLKNNDTEFNTKYGIRLQSQVNACSFTDIAMQYVETGVALEDNIMPDGETYNASLNYSSNQNVFSSIDIETCKYGYYLNSESCVFINCRAEGSLNDGIDHYGIYVPALNNMYCRYNVFIGFVLFGWYLSLTNEEFPNTKFSLIGGITPAKNGYNDSNSVYNTICNTLQCVSLAFKGNKSSIGGNTHEELYLQSKEIRLGNTQGRLSFYFNGTKVVAQLINNTTFTQLFTVESAADFQLQLERGLSLKNFDNKASIPYYYGRIVLCCVGNDVYMSKNGNSKRVIYGTDIPRKGATENRPTLEEGDATYCYFDTDLNKPIWWSGTAWVDATGATV